MCKASIIVPAYNAEKYIQQTLNSIISQSFHSFECIVIDDGSTDKTAEIVQSLNDARFKLIKINNSGGPSVPRNIGLMNAKGEYIFLFDSDDIMATDKLKLSVAALDLHQDADFLFTNFIEIDKSGKVIQENFLKKYHFLWAAIKGCPENGDFVLLASDVIYAALINTNFIGTSSVAIRKSALQPDDRFNEDLKNSDDRLFWLRFTKRHNAIYLNECLHQYRSLDDGISAKSFILRGPNKIKALELAYVECERLDLKAILARQIADDFAVLAFSYKKNKNHRKQIEMAKSSLKWRINFLGIKQLVLGYTAKLLFLN